MCTRPRGILCSAKFIPGKRGAASWEANHKSLEPGATALLTPSYHYTPTSNARLQALSIHENRLGGTGALGEVSAIQVGYGPAVQVYVSINGGAEWTPVVPISRNNEALDSEGNIESPIFEYHPPFLLGSVEPSSGPAIGGTLVTVSLFPMAAVNGSDSLETWQFSFDPAWDTSVKCLFNSTVVPATVVSNSSVECVAPPTVSGGGASFVRVSVNGLEMFDCTVANSVYTDALCPGGGKLEFFYLPDEEEMSLFPASGPVKGGTIVEVSSRHIANAAAALFLSEAIDGANHGNLPTGNKDNGSYPLRLLPSLAMCSFGGGAAVAASDLSFHWDGTLDADGHETGVGRVLCVSPPAPNDTASAVSVEVSLNGGSDFTQHGAQFYYRPQAYVSSIEPAYGPVTGGNPVRVEGGPFRDESAGGGGSEQMLLCRFGDQEVGATVHTAGLVSCRAPPMPAVAEEQDIEVRVSVVGREEQKTVTYAVSGNTWQPTANIAKQATLEGAGLGEAAGC